MNSLNIAWLMIRRTLGRKRGILSYLLLPCVVVTAAVALLGNDDNMREVIPYVNEDQGAAGAAMIQELSLKSEYVLQPMDSEAEVQEKIQSQKGSIGLVIPSRYTERLLAGEPASVRLTELKVTEGSYAFKAAVEGLDEGFRQSAAAVRQAALNDANGAAGSSVTLSSSEMDGKFEQLLAETGKHRISGETTELRIYPKPGLNNVTGFTIMFMMGLVSSAVTVIMEDRRQRTMARVYTAPVRAHEIAIGNFLGSMAIGLVQIVLVLAISRWVLHYDAGIPFGTHVLILGAFMLVAMGIASTVAGLVRKSQNVGMLNSLIITPTCMLGGCFWPLSIMPDYMQKIANVVPQKWTIQAVETISAGGTLSDIRMPLLILGIMALILLTVGSAILRPTQTGEDA
ncbi:ABC transporter permease [Paenibacillus hubeiensis]|uniref:ABC transporter permease n=1 Tax=Paenibacillus hubeiensis TaxID=3077330 RepID=UPI0031BBCA8B